jgi:hypothetical protein
MSKKIELALKEKLSKKISTKIGFLHQVWINLHTLSTLITSLFRQIINMILTSYPLFGVDNRTIVLICNSW